MLLIGLSTVFIGSMSGITKYKQQSVDYKLIGTYFGIITPYQVVNLYSNLDLLSKIRLQGVKPYVHLPMAVLMLTIANGSVFGIGYVVGKSAYSALGVSRHL